MSLTPPFHHLALVPTHLPKPTLPVPAVDIDIVIVVDTATATATTTTVNTHRQPRIDTPRHATPNFTHHASPTPSTIEHFGAVVLMELARLLASSRLP